MELVLFLALITSILSVVFMKRQKRLISERFSQRRSRRYNSRANYLDQVKTASEKRFKEEQAAQVYKNKIKKDYL